MDFLPAFLNIRGKTALVVGGGEVAMRKATLLDRAGARLRVVAPEIEPPLAELIRKQGGEPRLRGFQADDLDAADLVISATDDRALNETVSREAKARNLQVNVVDQPDLSTFIFPAILDRSPIVVAVSSGGDAPVLARLLRARLESLIPAAYGKLAALAGEYRDRVKAAIESPGSRRRFWENVLQGDVAELVYSGRESQARERLGQMIASGEDHPAVTGEVYLVGAGPGDPDLLTFRALRLMQQADIVLYDRLVAPEILDMVRRDADRIHVGKARSDHTVPQQEINEMLVRLAKQGKRVLRLKGGDPFIFGRGGEEIDRLAEEGVPFQVVPGITAASGCAAYAGIPLTHRDYAQSVRFVTGHLKNGTVDLPWKELIHPGQTLVVYMGLTGLEYMCEQLIAHGMPASMPIALVERGTTAEQRVVVGTLEDMAGQVEEAGVGAPTLMIVGEVVRLREKLNWHLSGA